MKLIPDRMSRDSLTILDLSPLNRVATMRTTKEIYQKLID